MDQLPLNIFIQSNNSIYVNIDWRKEISSLSHFINHEIVWAINTEKIKMPKIIRRHEIRLNIRMRRAFNVKRFLLSCSQTVYEIKASTTMRMNEAFIKHYGQNYFPPFMCFSCFLLPTVSFFIFFVFVGSLQSFSMRFEIEKKSFLFFVFLKRANGPKIPFF